jgi:hypothetical protein
MRLDIVDRISPLPLFCFLGSPVFFAANKFSSENKFCNYNKVLLCVPKRLLVTCLIWEILTLLIDGLLCITKQAQNKSVNSQVST